MKPIGGELAFQALNENIYFTDSGRSSLRLFIRNGNQNKKFLIPNFLCEVIENILVEENIRYEFYNILEDLTIDLNSLVDKYFDVFYNINYFGQLQSLENIGLENKIVIEDNVFFYDFSNRNNFKYWFGFNSFRKISPLADGSMIKTNLDIDDNLIIKREASFVKEKYLAKNIKYDFLYDLSKNYSELCYLKKFEEAEMTLNQQNEIYSISNLSVSLLNSSNHQNIKKKRFVKLLKIFEKYCINQKSIEYSFFVIKIEDSMRLQNKLKNNRIFLPIHWSKSTQENRLYNRVISVPLFEFYTHTQFNRIIKSLKELI